MMPQNVFNPMRRRLLKSLSAGLFTHGLGDLLTRQQLAVADATRRCEARNVLVIYEEGGISQPYTPYDYAETIYRKLGIDTSRRLMLPDRRPVEFTDGGRPISELFA